MNRKEIFSLSGVFFSIVLLVLASLYLQEPQPAGKAAPAILDKKETEEAYDLSYRWIDFSEKPLSVTFSILKKTYAEADEEFGYREKELSDYLQRISLAQEEETVVRLKAAAAQLINLSPFSQQIRVEEQDARSFSLKFSAPPEIQEKAKAEFDRIKLKLKQERLALAKKNEKELASRRKVYLEERGLRILGDKLGINYEFCVRHNRDRLNNVFEAMRESGREKNLQQFLRQLLSFIQEIRYGLPPLREGDKCILEFWVPPKVLVNNLGDCDSKGIAFSSIWTNFRKFPLLVIKMPKHLIIGIALPSFSEEGFVINGTRFSLLEVTGPERMPPGLITPYSQLYLEGRRFSYEIVN